MIKELTPEALLLSGKTPTYSTSDPFAVWVFDDFLPAAAYEALLESYPKPDERWRRVDTKWRLPRGRDGFDSVVAERPAWQQLMACMADPIFVQDFAAFTAPAINAARGDTSGGQWELGPTPDGKVVSTEFDFTTMAPGDQIWPHCDAKTKLTSVLLYFPTADWNPEWRGGTAFYRARNADAFAHWCTWENNHVDPAEYDAFYRDFEQFYYADFKPNRFVMFIKNTASYHTVPPVECPDSTTRQCFLFNVRKGGAEKGDSTRAEREKEKEQRRRDKEAAKAERQRLKA